MEEEKNITLDPRVDIELRQQNTEVSEIIETINVDPPAEMNIDVSEVTGVVTGMGSSSEHTHTIEQIDYLVDKLKELGASREVYSQHGGYAEFRAWTKDNDSYYVKNIKNNISGSVGYFVGLVEYNGNTYLDVCHEGNTDVYGVVVGSSAFCGYQNEGYNLFQDSNDLWFTNPPIDKSDGLTGYAKVCLLGDAMVRINKSDWDSIEVGDYVVPGYGGSAKKSDNGTGFRVVSRGQTGGVSNPDYQWYYVTIALVPQNDNVAHIVSELQGAKQGLNNLTIQIGKLEEDITNISGTTSIIEDEFKELEETVGSKLDAADTALKEAQNIATKAEASLQKSITQQTNVLGRIEQSEQNVGEALAGIREGMQILSEYKSPDGKKSGVQGVVDEINDYGARFGALQQWQDETKAELTSIQQIIGEDGAAIQLLVAHADLYSVGELSPTSGLSFKEAQGVLGTSQFIYVPTTNHSEVSHIYNCTATAPISQGDAGYFKINETIYTFVAPYALSNNSTYEYNSRTKNLIINNETTVKVKETTAVSGPELSFISEKINDFYMRDEDHKGVYGWMKIVDSNDYEWRECDVEISYASAIPEQGRLWYCANGILNDNREYIYLPGTLYLWEDGKWIAVTTINDSSARAVSLINQTAESISATVTDVQGNLADITIQVDEINSTVSKHEDTFTNINQTAEDIILGTYSAENFSSLELLLNGMRSEAAANEHIKIGDFVGSAPEPYDGKKYATAPVWNGSGFEFAGESVADGKYWFYSEDHLVYYQQNADRYELYTIGNRAMANLSSRVSNTESQFESWTQFETEVNKAITSITQKSNESAAEMVSMVFGEYKYLDKTVHEPTDEDLAKVDATYKEAPSWSEGKFTFDGESTEKGTYCIPSGDDTEYWELTYDKDDNVNSYKVYKMQASNYATLMQKVDENGSNVSLVVGGKDVEGGVFVKAINDSTEALIRADKIGINGVAVFRDNLIGNTTTISGNAIQTGVLTSNNYVGPKTYVMYGAKLDEDESKIIKGDSLDDCIYYTPIVEGEFSSSVEEQDYYYVNKIDVNEVLFKEFQENPKSEYVVSAKDFDLISSNIPFDGMKIDLNYGTIYSKNLQFDKDGNLSITGRIEATSGYIGDKHSGFKIDHGSTLLGLLYVVPDGGLSKGKYYFEYNNKYYVFEVDSDLDEGVQIYYDEDTQDITISNEVIFYKTTTDKPTVDDAGVAITELVFKGQYRWYLSNNQSNIAGTDSMQKGIYVGTNGIGIGNGAIQLFDDGRAMFASEFMTVSEEGITITGYTSIDRSGDLVKSVKPQVNFDASVDYEAATEGDFTTRIGIMAAWLDPVLEKRTGILELAATSGSTLQLGGYMGGTIQVVDPCTFDAQVTLNSEIIAPTITGGAFIVDDDNNNYLKITPTQLWTYRYDQTEGANQIHGILVNVDDDKTSLQFYNSNSLMGYIRQVSNGLELNSGYINIGTSISTVTALGTWDFSNAHSVVGAARFG